MRGRPWSNSAGGGGEFRGALAADHIVGQQQQHLSGILSSRGWPGERREAGGGAPERGRVFAGRRRGDSVIGAIAAGDGGGVGALLGDRDEHNCCGELELCVYTSYKTMMMIGWMTPCLSDIFATSSCYCCCLCNSSRPEEYPRPAGAATDDAACYSDGLIIRNVPVLSRDGRRGIPGNMAFPPTTLSGNLRAVRV